MQSAAGKPITRNAMNPKAIIADDEAALRTYLRSLLAQVWPELEICGEAANGAEAVRLVEACRPDVAFLDIRCRDCPEWRLQRPLPALAASCS